MPEGGPAAKFKGAKADGAAAWQRLKGVKSFPIQDIKGLG
jgi:hypothetical protein